MAEFINTNSISLMAQNNLSKSQASLGTAIERLSSGLRINSAKDDAAGEAIANRFTSSINGLNQASSNANDGISLAQTTEGALDEINDNLQAVRTLTVQAQTGTNSSSDLQSIQDEITQRMAEVNRISAQTDFNGTKVLASTKSLSVQVGADDGQTISINLQQVDATTLGLGTFNVNGAVGQTSTVLTPAGATAAAKALTTVADAGTIKDASGNSSTLAAGDLATIKVGGTAITGGTLENDASGNTYFVNTAGTSVQQVTGYNATTNDVTLGTAVTGTTTTGTFTPATSTIQGTAVSSITISDSNLSPTAAETSDFTSGSSLETDSNGNYFVKSSSGDTYAATVAVDSTGAVTVTADSSKAIANAATTDPLATLDNAISEVDTMRSNLGAIQNRLDSTIDNISNTTTNLSTAQSQIQDADYATEVSDMSKAQILQQAGTSVLAQANQIPQTVLSLLK